MAMNKKSNSTSEEGLSRRHFIKRGAGAALAVGYLTTMGSEVSAAPASRNKAFGIYICPPCGQPCDKLTFDKPGDCPQCGMKLIPMNGGAGSPPTVAILLFNGAEIVDFAGPWEAFGTAGFLVHTVAENLEPQTMVFGQKVVPDFTFENSPKSDVLLVPGGGVGGPMNNTSLIRWIKTKAGDVSHVMSVCTGALILAQAGLLDGLEATVTYGMEEPLQQMSSNVKVISPRRFVDAGKIITTAGLTSGIDGALHLISKMAGIGAAQSAALSMEYRLSPDANFSRAALADRYLPEGLKYGKAKLSGIDAKVISTSGDTDRWEMKLLVSEPKAEGEIMEVLRNRIKSNTTHIRGSVLFSEASGKESARSSQVKWHFTDDQGHGWTGSAVAARSSEEKEKFNIILMLARAR